MKDITEIPVSQLHAFEGHPYKVLDNEEMEELTGKAQLTLRVLFSNAKKRLNSLL